MIRLSALGANLLLGGTYWMSVRSTARPMSGRALSLAEFYYLSLYFFLF